MSELLKVKRKENELISMIQLIMNFLYRNTVVCIPSKTGKTCKSSKNRTLHNRYHIIFIT